MADLLKLACVQMTSGSNINENLENAGSLIRKAALMGASFVATPENTCQMKSRVGGNKKAISQDDHIGIAFFADLAKELKINILIGSMLVESPDDGKEFNRSFLFSKNGGLKSIYDKIHLCDVSLSTGESHRESAYIKTGDKAVITKIDDDFTLGMSICYDLRFPYLYRDMAKSGANIISIPAAFTVPTGQAHWEILLRARAIETGSYVIAPAQFGDHYEGRKTYGNSMIIDPWGRVLEQLETGHGVIMADLDISEVNKARQAVPALQHGKDYEITRA